MTITDPITAGLARGWKVHGGQHAGLPQTLGCDVVIVGSGAGAGISAELLTQAGLDVVIVEEGPLRSSSQFRQLESEAYPSLYQDAAARRTADQAIGILQGRCVGGSTTVNWTSSFRTPAATLAWWRDHLGLAAFTDAAVAPWFAQAEARLSIQPWLVPPNANNERLRTGAARLGIPAAAILRNVRGCWNLGACGLGCPTNAKQSMLVTTIPAALDRGARLLVQTRAERLLIDGDAVRGVEVRPVTLNGTPAGDTLRITARHVVVAGGAINSPALLMRSKAPDPHARLGRRTFLHPVVVSSAVFDEAIEGWSGAPQTLYTDHFLDVAPIDGPIGYKLEAPPLYPLIAASTLPGYGEQQARLLADFPRTHALLALLRDGFHAQSPGGRVTLRSDGSPALDYPLNAFVMDGARRALLSMSEIQFAAGAKRVLPVHEQAQPYRSWAEARDAISRFAMEPLLTRVLSAHVMGGCAMSPRAEDGVVTPEGRHWQLDNVSVHDGSIFPTSIGANPQLSVYGFATMLATRLARELTGRDVRLAA